MKKIFLFTYSIALLLGLGACKKGNLDVENQNNPNFLKVYSSGEDILNVTSGLYNTIHLGEDSPNGVKPILAAASDNVTASHGNFGLRDVSFEPRDNAWDNSPAYSYAIQTNTTYNQMYAAINTANLIIKALNAGTEINSTAGQDNNKLVKAFARFAQGVAYGNLAMIFDRSFIVDEAKTTGASLSEASNYKLVAEAAVGYLDEAISISQSGGFSVPLGWMGTNANITSENFARICNTMAARILSYTPRNKTDLAAVNWTKVKTYADAGIISDLINQMDDNVWYDEAGYYLTTNGWGRVDMYVVHLMDSAQPQHWDDSASFPHPPASVNPQDKRLTTDFQYQASNTFRPERGYYHFSNYRFSRYDAVYVTWIGPKPLVLKAENDMLKAEARIYSSTPDLTGAADILNASSRKLRGDMANVTANLTDLVKAIHHERHVELYNTGVGVQFFEMRKLNLLQKGTPLHFPLPARLLETLGEAKPFYTFGTVAKADGINTSNAGWR